MSSAAKVANEKPPPATAEDKTKPEPNPDDARVAAVALLETWKAAQNQGDSATYFTQYETQEFKGLKRTHRGKVAKYDFAGWHKDRSGMFASPFEVAVEALQIETWLDAKSTLKPGLIRVRFLQRWRSKSYADHGPKTLLLWRHPRSGETRIVFEELLLSRPGWDEQSVAEGRSYPTLAQAATVEEMTAALRAIDADVHQVVTVPAELDDSFHSGLLLQAAFALGPLDCLEKITYTECGQDSEDWGLVEGAKLDHPCVRRALVMALLDDPLPAEALDAVAPALTRVLDLTGSTKEDPELGAAVLSAVATLPEARRLPFLSTALNDVAGRWNEAAAPLLAKLRPESLYTLWTETKNPAALRPLPAAEHATKLAELHQQTDLPNDLMLPVLAALEATQERALLADLADSPDCELSMTAAHALSKLGDASRLPTWNAAHDIDGAKRAVCMLRHDPDEARALAELRRFFHPTRAVRYARLSVIYNQGVSQDDAPEPSEQEQEQTAAASELVGAPQNHEGVPKGSVETLPLGPQPELLLGTSVFDKDSASSPTSYDVMEFFEENGHVYLDYVGDYFHQWLGCPC